MRKILLNKVIYCQTFVSPGIGATLHTFLLLSVLITELLPTLGYPINPTLICFLSECNFANCLNNWMSAPLPNGLVMDAWNAKVGKSFDKTLTHLAVAHVGIKSHLFNTKINCLCFLSFLI